MPVFRGYVSFWECRWWLHKCYSMWPCWGDGNPWLNHEEEDTDTELLVLVNLISKGRKYFPMIYRSWESRWWFQIFLVKRLVGVGFLNPLLLSCSTRYKNMQHHAVAQGEWEDPLWMRWGVTSLHFSGLRCLNMHFISYSSKLSSNPSKRSVAYLKDYFQISYMLSADA